MAGHAATAAVSARAIRATPMAPGASTTKDAGTAAIGIVTGTPGTAIAIVIRAADPSPSPSAAGSAAPTAAAPTVSNPVSSLRTLPPARTPALRRRPRLQRARRARIVRSAAGAGAVAGVAADAAGAVVRARAASDRLREVPAHPSAGPEAEGRVRARH